MKQKAILVIEQINQTSNSYTITCRTECLISLTDIVYLNDLASYRIKAIELYRKNVEHIPEGYSGLLTLDLVEGVHDLFKKYDYLFSKNV
jgi:hypothetical protein